MLRIVLGLLKGGLVGAAVGYGASRLGVAAGGGAWLTYGALGFLVGTVCGKPPWRQETLWTSIIKGVFGLLACMGLYWVAQRVLGGTKVPSQVADLIGASSRQALVTVPAVLAPVVGAAFGILVEIDDGGKAKAKPAKAAK